MQFKSLLIAWTLVVVGYAIVHSNMELRSGIGTGNSWGMTWSFSQGWPIPQRDLHVQEIYAANTGVIPNAVVTTEILDSTWIPLGLLLNSIVALTLLSSVATALRIWPRSKLGGVRFGLMSLMFSFCVIAIVTASFANGLSGASILADLFDDRENYFHYVDMPKWHTLIPIAFAIACTGYVILRSMVYLWNRMRRACNTTIAGQPIRI